MRSAGSSSSDTIASARVPTSATGTTTKAWEFVKNYTKTNAWNPKNVVVVNERAFSRLSKQEQNALTKAAAAAVPNKFPTGNNFTCTASSFHPGGCNFALCDGSVKFIKDTVNSWNPLMVNFTDRSQPYTGAGGVLPTYGVYQALHTRNGGEIVSADQY